MTKATGFKATVERAALVQMLSRVTNVVEARNTIPILSNVLIIAKDDWLSVRGTDLDLELTDRCKAEVAAPGSITVPGKMFADIAKKLPVGCQIVLDFDADKGVLAVKAGRSRFTLHTLPETDFPDLATGDLTHTFSLPAADLTGLIDRASFAISSEETRYSLNGVYFHHTKGDDGKEKLRGVATDGHRLARIDIALPDGAANMPGIIVPRKTVGQVKSLFGSSKEPIQVELSQAKIRFTSGDIVLTSKLIDGTFPDYGRVIPQNNNKIALMDRVDLESAIDRVATVSTERGRAVKLSFSASKLVSSVTNPESGSAVEELEIEYDADVLDIGFNSRYLADILKVVAGEKVRMQLEDPGSPTILKGDDEASIYVLMPMRV